MLVIKVNYIVEDIWVDGMSLKDWLILDIWINGSIQFWEVLLEVFDIIVNFFIFFKDFNELEVVYSDYQDEVNLES